MLPLVIISSALTIVLILAGWFDDCDFAARGRRARAAALYRAQERWAMETDRRHGVNVDGMGRSPVERRHAERRRGDCRRVA